MVGNVLSKDDGTAESDTEREGYMQRDVGQRGGGPVGYVLAKDDDAGARVVLSVMHFAANVLQVTAKTFLRASRIQLNEHLSIIGGYRGTGLALPQ